MTIISKIAGGLSLFSCLTDAHKTGLIYANNEYAKASGDTFISCSLGAQKADKISSKDAQRKNWLLRNNFLGGINEGFAKVGGYFKGFGNSIVRYLPNIALSAVALKFQTAGKVAGALLAASGLKTLVYDVMGIGTKKAERKY